MKFSREGVPPSLSKGHDFHTGRKSELKSWFARHSAIHYKIEAGCICDLIAFVRLYNQTYPELDRAIDLTSFGGEWPSFRWCLICMIVCTLFDDFLYHIISISVPRQGGDLTLDGFEYFLFLLFGAHFKLLLNCERIMLVLTLTDLAYTKAIPSHLFPAISTDHG